MSVELDQEILNDFIIEVTEIIDDLDQRLLELESNPEDNEQLNAIFRGFHTIKGGAGFLAIEPLVQICHDCESIFDLLRKKEICVSQDMIDCILQGIDHSKSVIAQLGDGKEPPPVKPVLLQQLNSYTNMPQPGQSGKTVAISNNEIDKDEITDDEFEALLDELQEKNLGAFHSTDQAVIHATSDISVEKSGEVTEKPQLESELRSPSAHVISSRDKSVRVETRILDNIMNMVGELVLMRNRLVTLSDNTVDSNIATTIANLDLVTTDLQQTIMKTRMQPVKKIFGRFPRVVREVAHNLNKEVKLETRGEDTELDKNLVEELSDPMIHLIRNSIDHGIESPGERLKRNKSQAGTITLAAEQEGDQILLTITDDGAGIDADKIKGRLVENELMQPEEVCRLTDEECFDMIFLPGFSTKDDVSDISGRGVGLDVVKSTINRLNGNITILSDKGIGSSIEIRVPLTLAILPALLVRIVSSNEFFAIPLVNVTEILDYKGSNIHMVDGQPNVLLRGAPIPLFYLNTWLGHSEDNEHVSGDATHIVIVNIGTNTIALIIDNLVAREEIVIKPLGTLLAQVSGIAGATITGDGNIALILDIPGLAESRLVKR